MTRINTEHHIKEFLRRNKGIKFKVKEIHNNLLLVGLRVSYNTVLKWSEVLIAKGEVKCEDYGNVKLIWMEE